MTRHINPEKRLVQEFHPVQPQLSIDKLIVQYIRQSTLVQVKNNKQSAILQDIKLTRRLMAYGWPDERIIKIDADQGKSGQKRRDERVGLDELYRFVLSGKAGAVAAYDASRLYRDLTRVHYTDFVHMCETYNIVVVTCDTVYWPHIKRDMDALIDKFAEAARFIDEVVHGKLIPAKMQVIEDAQSYGGHCVPMGYYVAEDELEERKYYVIYEPHASIVRWLFKRYRELGGNLGQLGREIRAMNLTFPPFASLESIPHVALRWTGKGYVLRTRGGLISILTNPAYIGYYIYNCVLISKKAHDAIVDMDDFLYAYSRLSPVTLEGQENTAKPKLVRRQCVACDALLENILESDGNPVYVMAGNQTYTAKTNADGWKTVELVAPVSLIDQEFSTALRMTLLELEKRHQQGFQDGLYDLLQQAQETVAQEGDILASELEKVLKGIRQAELDKKIALEEEYADGIRDATRRLKRLHADREALEAKLARSGKEQADLGECQSLSEQALHQWDSMKFSIKLRFVRLLVAQANITAASPHFLRLDIVIGTPFYRVLTGFLYRKHGSRAPWTLDETAALHRLYPSTDRLDVMKALPMRSWESIVQQANIADLPRTTRLNTANNPEQLAYADMLIMQQEQINQDSTPRNDATYYTAGVWRSQKIPIEDN
ncbi:MAG: recombinase family protein [Ktedonobacteraceae bacterium]